MNREKHPKTAMVEMLLADESTVPTRARSNHVVGHYIKDRNIKYTGGRSRLEATPAPFLIRLDGASRGPDAESELRVKVFQMNSRLRRARLPFRLRML
jgi:hypothetical protein